MNGYRAGILAGAAAATMLLAGCGESNGFADQPPAEIEAAMLEAMSQVKSVRIAGSAFEDGEPARISAEISARGACRGSISGDGGAFEFRRVGGQTWLKDSEELIEDIFQEEEGRSATQREIDFFSMKWVETGDAPEIRDVCVLDRFLKDFTLTSEPADLEVGDTDEVSGIGVVELLGEIDNGDEISLFISAEAPHRIVQLQTRGEEPGDLSFRDYNNPVDVKPPAARNIQRAP